VLEGPAYLLLLVALQEGNGQGVDWQQLETFSI
jgi:hypothetical protein